MRGYMRKLPDAIGALLVDVDGGVLANFMPQHQPIAPIAHSCLEMIKEARRAAAQVCADEGCRIYSMVSMTPQRCVVIGDFGGGLMIALSNCKSYDALFAALESES